VYHARATRTSQGASTSISPTRFAEDDEIRVPLPGLRKQHRERLTGVDAQAGSAAIALGQMGVPVVQALVREDAALFEDRHAQSRLADVQHGKGGMVGSA